MYIQAYILTYLYIYHLHFLQYKSYFCSKLQSQQAPFPGKALEKQD